MLLDYIGIYFKEVRWLVNTAYMVLCSSQQADFEEQILKVFNRSTYKVKEKNKKLLSILNKVNLPYEITSLREN